MRWGLGQENSPHYYFANTKECLQSIFSIDKKIIKKNLVWLNCNYSDGISNPYLQCNTTYHIRKTKKVWYPHGTIFFKLCLKDTLHSGFQLSFWTLHWGVPKTPACVRCNTH